MSLKKHLLKILLLASTLYIYKSQQEDSDAINEDEDQMIEEDEKPQNTDVFAKLHVYRVRSKEELNYLVELQDFTMLQFYYAPSSERSKKVAEDLIKIHKRLDGLAVIIAINCDEFTPADYNHCKKNDLTVDPFPRLRLFVSPEKRYDPKTNSLEKHSDIPFMGKSMNETTIFNFITNNIQSKSLKLTDESLFPFLISDAMNKVILFTDKVTPGLIFRGLTHNFYDRLLFGTVEWNERDILNRFNITKFPTLMVYKTMDFDTLMEEPEEIFYDGDPADVSKIISFLDQFALPEKRYVGFRRGIGEESSDSIARKLEFKEINPDNYMNFFKRYHDKNLLVVFHTKNKLKISVKRYIVENQGFWLAVWFNCKNEKKFCLEKFGVEDFPTSKVFYPTLDKNADLAVDPRSDEAQIQRIESRSNLLSVKYNSTFVESVQKTWENSYNVRHTTSMQFNYDLAEGKMAGKIFLLFMKDSPIGKDGVINFN